MESICFTECCLSPVFRDKHGPPEVAAAVDISLQLLQGEQTDQKLLSPSRPEPPVPQKQSGAGASKAKKRKHASDSEEEEACSSVPC